MLCRGRSRCSCPGRSFDVIHEISCLRSMRKKSKDTVSKCQRLKVTRGCQHVLSNSAVFSWVHCLLNLSAFTYASLRRDFPTATAQCAALAELWQVQRSRMMAQRVESRSFLPAKGWKQEKTQKHCHAKCLPVSSSDWFLLLFTPLHGRVRPHQGYKVSYYVFLLLLLLVVVVVVVVPGQIF